MKQPDSEIDCPDKHGTTALHLAAWHGNPGAVHRLLDNGADACRINADGLHTLHLAACKGHTEIVETLIGSESDMEFIDHVSKDGHTPLLLAAKQGKADVVGLLAEHGANLRLREKGGRTALQLGAANGHAHVAEVLLSKITPLLLGPGDPGRFRLIIQEALSGAIRAGHAGVVEVFLRSQPYLASLLLDWHAYPVIADLRNRVHLVSEPQQANDERLVQFPGLANCVAGFVTAIDLSVAASDNGAFMGTDWLVSTGSYAVIGKKLQEACKGIAAMQRTLAGSESQVWPTQTRLVAAGLLASLGEPSIFNAPYTGKGLSPGVETCFNELALHHAHLLAQAGEEAEQHLVSTLGNLHGICMGSFAEKSFHQVDLYFYLTRQCGLYDIPAKRISDAFAGTWLQHKQSDTTVRERALAQALSDRSRSREALEQIAHDSARSGNEVTFHWLLNRQLDLVNAWHRKVLGTAVQYGDLQR